MSSYRLIRLRARSGDWPELLQVFDRRLEGAPVWARWHGLFGLASNELLVMLSAEVSEEVEQTLAELADVTSDERWRATARPTSDTPLSREGLYVLRRFQVDARNVAEVVDLSRSAWETFETDADFAAEPFGLFAPAEPRDGQMLLVTWYDGFASWQRSRNPAPEAQDNFRRRHRLTRPTSAIAVRLLTSGDL